MRTEIIKTIGSTIFWICLIIEFVLHINAVLNCWTLDTVILCDILIGFEIIGLCLIISEKIIKRKLSKEDK